MATQNHLCRSQLRSHRKTFATYIQGVEERKDNYEPKTHNLQCYHGTNVCNGTAFGHSSVHLYTHVVNTYESPKKILKKHIINKKTASYFIYIYVLDSPNYCTNAVLNDFHQVFIIIIYNASLNTFQHCYFTVRINLQLVFLTNIPQCMMNPTA